jgi:hypothetical protein
MWRGVIGRKITSVVAAREPARYSGYAIAECLAHHRAR